MSTTTVRLDDEDAALLDSLASEFGGRSGAIRHAIRTLAADRQLQVALQRFVAEWDDDAEPVDDGDVAAMVSRYGL